MARPRSGPITDVDKFVKHITKNEDYAERTIRFYRDEGRCIFKILNEQVSPDITAVNVTKADVYRALDYMRTNNYAIQTMKGYMTALRRICLFNNNLEPQKTRIRWPQDMRPNVDWLKHNQAQTLLDCDKTPIQELIVHLELCMGLRCIEVARLQTDNIFIERGYITVIGKASKLRLVPFHPDTARVLRRYNEYRKMLIGVAKANNPNAEVPVQFVIWGKGRRLSPYSQVKLTGIVKHLDLLKEQVGFHFSNHTLRRTFGRTMYHSDVPLATIAKLLGHESTDTTLKYIGVDLDDMGTAMSQYILRKSTVEEVENIAIRGS